MRLVAVLDRLADDRHARGAQQLAQLGEVVALGQRGDAEGALLRASLQGHLAVPRRRCVVRGVHVACVPV